MRKPIKSSEFIELDEIRKMVRDRLARRLNKTGIYFYIKEHAFPMPVGLARPRKWERQAVLDWVEKQALKV